MNRKLKTIVGATAATAFAVTALAQEMSTSQSTDKAPEYKRMYAARLELLKETSRASHLIGLPVENYQHEKLGKVDTLYINLKSGRIVQVVISTGGILGMDSRVTAVPPGVLHGDETFTILHLGISKEKFMASPTFDTIKPDSITESNRVDAVYTYYGQQSYFVADPQGFWTTNRDGTVNTDGARNQNKEHNAEIDRHVGEKSNTISTSNPDGSRSRNYYSNENEAIASFSDLGIVRNVKDLRGMTIRNLDGAKIGKVQDFILDLSAGRVAATVILTGSLFGTGGTISCAPSTALRFNAKNHCLDLDATTAMLEASPEFSINNWPNFVLPGYLAGTYFPYKIEPFNNAELDHGRDATAINVRKNDTATLPVLTQGKDSNDVDVKAAIRAAIEANQDMSANAKNILIITEGGKVTLRGPVANGEEKRIIGEIASRLAPSKNVDNQLEVQLTTTPNSTSKN